MRAAFLLLLLAATPAAAEAPEANKKPRLVVTDFVPAQVEPGEAQALTDAVATYLAQRGLFDVVSSRDLQTLLGAERQRQLLGACGDDGVACSADLSSLVQARFVLSGQLARVGSAWQLSLQMVDTAKGQAAARGSRLSGSLEALRAMVPYLASEATGSPLPPPPSRVLPITLIGVGSATALSGGVVGLLALSRQGQLQDELCPGGVQPDGRCDGVNLRPHEFYVEQQATLTAQKALSVGLMAGGAVLLGLGLWLMPPDDARTRLAVRVVPAGGGLALVGGF
jgi:TolB-like protein